MGTGVRNGALAIVATVAAVLLCAGCQSDDPAEQFDQGIRGSATCEELFAWRNELNPHDARIEQMNENLRSVGCYMSSDTRKP